MTSSSPRFARPLLGGLLALVALNAIGGGLYGLAGAEAVPREWLEGSPFDSYFVPSLVLLVLVGGTFSVASLSVARGTRRDRPLALTAGAVALAWIAAQVAIIGYVSWLQPAVALAGLAVIALASALPARG